MANTNNRFKTILKEGSTFSSYGLRTVIVDKETGVNYLLVNTGYGAGITPILDADGKPVITKSQ